MAPRRSARQAAAALIEDTTEQPVPSVSKPKKASAKGKAAAKGASAEADPVVEPGANKTTKTKRARSGTAASRGEAAKRGRRKSVAAKRSIVPVAGKPTAHQPQGHGEGKHTLLASPVCL
jgi:hypothetical protein